MRERWPGWMNVALGIWLVVSPFLLRFPDRPDVMWNSVVSGGLIFLVALAAMNRFKVEEGVNVLVALWLIASPWIVGFRIHAVALLNHVIVGVLVLVCSLWHYKMLEERRFRLP